MLLPLDLPIQTWRGQKGDGRSCWGSCPTWDNFVLTLGKVLVFSQGDLSPGSVEAWRSKPGFCRSQAPCCSFPCSAKKFTKIGSLATCFLAWSGQSVNQLAFPLPLSHNTTRK